MGLPNPGKAEPYSEMYIIYLSINIEAILKKKRLEGWGIPKSSQKRKRKEKHGRAGRMELKKERKDIWVELRGMSDGRRLESREQG